MGKRPSFLTHEVDATESLYLLCSKLVGELPTLLHRSKAINSMRVTSTPNAHGG